MNRIEITIKGPGGVIDNEALLIKELLESKGANVSIEGTIAIDKTQSWRDSKNINAKIIVDGQPWGG